MADEELVKQLPGFTSSYLTVDGVRLHYVMGGQGKPLVLLPGWPHTWWSYHKIMPLLTENYQVIVVELRGMGSSAKPPTGYTKKAMAGDVAGLLDQLGIGQANIAGHDIGAAVAFSFGAHFPRQTSTLILLDSTHPDDNLYKLPMLPVGAGVYPWWLAFNQIRDLPEQLLEGRFDLVQNWLFDQLLEDKTAISPFDRQIYARLTIAGMPYERLMAGTNSLLKTFMLSEARRLKHQRLASPDRPVTRCLLQCSLFVSIP